MYLCPNCRRGYQDLMNSCGDCHWKLEKIEDIPVLLSNSDDKDLFFKEYNDNYHELSLKDLKDAIVEKKYLFNQAVKMLSYYQGEPKSILEVGVGQGFLLEKIRSKYPHARITAVDISIPFLKHVKSIRGVECLAANAENLPFEDMFDLVVTSDILEHVINPIDFLLSTNYSLKNGGTLMLRVPFEDNMLQYSRLLGCEYKFAHLRNFSTRNLSLMLDQAGFKVNKIHYDGFYAYKKRKFLNKWKLSVFFDKFIKRYYPDENDVSKIPNWLGILFMKPLEIVVVAKKTRTVHDMNYPL